MNTCVIEDQYVSNGKVPTKMQLGRFGCFQHVAIVNCAAVNSGVHRLFWMGVSGLTGT